ncbi:PIG-P-domain-containing protein [Phascolomyces articulosus]|uniref:PIG-P-domain-containing protein n=1 Tax=Phascolomyces articulosus TaxID=60185 RepID=A0AAD5K483_9FUNG|nr:PIG-P-domain-containing protein [Phascolomyces articulosus]
MSTESTDQQQSQKRARFEEQNHDSQDDQHSAPESNDTRPSLLTSRSTPSLPALVNYALLATASLSKRPSISMQRGSSQQSRPSSSISPNFDEERRSAPVKRRNSFSSFLSTKYGPKGGKTTPAKLANIRKTLETTMETNDPTTTSTTTPSDDSTKFRKGHRPRSYSEIPAMSLLVERAPPVAITNKTPIYEYYGFVMYLASFVALAIYLIWAYVPDEILHSLGITYYPKRYWALAIPVWLMTLVWFVFFSFMSINLMNTAPFDSYYCLTDEHANVMGIDSCQYEEERPDDWMPELHDIPMSVANAFLYPAPPSQPTASPYNNNTNAKRKESIIHEEYKDSSEDGLLTIRRRATGKRNAI